MIKSHNIMYTGMYILSMHVESKERPSLYQVHYTRRFTMTALTNRTSAVLTVDCAEWHAGVVSGVVDNQRGGSEVLMEHPAHP